MSFTTSDLDAINAAIASGELKVQFSDRLVEYRSIADLKAARNLIIGDLQTTGAIATTRPRTSLAYVVRE